MNGRIIKFATAMAVMVMVFGVTAVYAQQTGNPPDFAKMQEQYLSGLQKAAGLTADQVAGIKKVMESQRPGGQGGQGAQATGQRGQGQGGQGQGGQGGGMRGGMFGMMGRENPDVVALLKGDQVEKYRTFNLNYQTDQTMTRYADLKFTDKQKTDVRKIVFDSIVARQKMMAGMQQGGDRQAMMEEMRAATTATNTKIEALLTPEQKTAFQALPQPGRGGGGGGRQQ